MDTEILVVEDQRDSRAMLEYLLEAHYRVRSAENCRTALEHLENGGRADLILLDVMMSGINGFEFCRLLKSNPAYKEVPVLFLTGLDSAEDEAHGLSLGAVDFIHKPLSPPVVLARVRTHLQLAEARRELRERNRNLEVLVLERTREVLRKSQEVISAQSATITAFCALAEARDGETGNHIRRTQNYVRALALKLREQPRFQDALDDESVQWLYKSAPLHDVGKVAIPDDILLNSNKLTPEQWEVMKRHCEYGRDAIVQAEQEIGEKADSFLKYAREIAYSHHEKWDGSGYPQGLAGEEIPLSARLMAVADVYDALISRRVYKQANSHQEARDMIIRGGGSHFDPDVVKAFVAISDEFDEIAQRFGDKPSA